MTFSRVRNVESMSVFLNSRELPGREPRVQVNMRASVQVSSERSVAAQILDLSRGGFRILTVEPLQTGQLVELSSGKDASIGQIRRIDGLEAGGVFVNHPPIVD